MNKQRLMAIFMLISFGIAVAVVVIGLIRGSEALSLSGFFVIMLAFLYSMHIKKQRERYYEEQEESKRLNSDENAEELKKELREEEELKYGRSDE